MKTNHGAKPLTELGGHARQGDTLLRRISAPASSRGKQLSKAILALGEKTGHHHSFGSGATAYAEEGELAETIEVTAPEAPLIHQEHDPITYPKASYESLKQKEYSPEALKPVTD